MAFDRPPSWSALKRRYTAGIQAVRQGADPALTLSLVVWPSEDVEQASRGEVPQGFRVLTEDEIRQRYNEDVRRYHAPVSKRWAA